MVPAVARAPATAAGGERLTVAGGIGAQLPAGYAEVADVDGHFGGVHEAELGWVRAGLGLGHRAVFAAGASAARAARRASEPPAAVRYAVKRRSVSQEALLASR